MLSTPEGAKLAADLLRDGMISFTPDTAQETLQQYVMLLGANRDTAVSLADRLYRGEATILTETIVNGKVYTEVARGGGAARKWRGSSSGTARTMMQRGQKFTGDLRGQICWRTTPIGLSSRML